MGSMLDTFVYENFTGDMDDLEYLEKHPDPHISSGAIAKRTNQKMTDDSRDEVADEMGVSSSMLNGVDPYDPRWKQMRERSYEIRQDSSGTDSQTADQQAFREIFG